MFIKVTDSNNVPYFVNINNISSFAWFEKDNLTLFMLSTGRSNAKETPEQILQMIQDEHTAREVAVREAILETPISSMFKVEPNEGETWQERLVSEKECLDAKLAKLKAFLATSAFQLLDPPQQKALLHQQREAMETYSEILKARIERS